MEITEKPGIGRLPLPLPIYTSVLLATAHSNDGEEFDIVAGLERKYVEEIKKRALDKSDEELQKNTSDRKRFGEGSYEEWYKKERTPFGLIHKKTGALAALVWLGTKPLEQKSGEWHTLSYRSYKQFRGKGLMKDFAKFAMKIYAGNYPGARYWINTEPKNKASIALASSLGFFFPEESSINETGRLVMIK